MFDSLVSGAKSIGHAAGGLLGGLGGSHGGGALSGAPQTGSSEPSHTGNPLGGNLPFPSMGPIAELLSGLPSMPHLDPSAAGELMSHGLGGIGKSIGGGISSAIGGIEKMVGGGLPDPGMGGELMGALPF